MPLEKLTKLSPSLHPKLWGCEVWFEHQDRLPVLVKFITTFDKLSVQVHPNDEYAQRHHGSAGKTEMWHILSAHPKARIAAGFREKLTPERLREAAESGQIEKLLKWRRAKPGDTFFIPAGTVHAIGGGLVLCEIQQYSDITYRLYDYGRPRELHLDHAVAVSQPEPHKGRAKARGDELVCCDYFTTIRRDINGRSEFPPEFRVFVVTEGKGSLDGNPSKEGEVWYAPSNTGSIMAEGELTVLAVAMKH